MKKYLAARMRITAILMAGALGTFVFVAPKAVEAQSAPEKIRLMAETLRARDSGNLEVAKAKAEELIKIAPNDENVQRLLASINSELDRRSGGTAVFGQAPDVSVEAAMKGESVATTGAASIAAAAAADQDTKIAAAENAIDEAAQLAELGAYNDATALLNTASASLALNTATADILKDLDEAKANVILTEAQALTDAGDLKAAEKRVEDYRAAGGDAQEADSLAGKLDQKISNPYALDVKEISPEYVAQSKIIRDLLARGRAQYLNGDYDGAAATFKEVEARDANNSEAKLFQYKISEILSGIHKQNFYKTREQMLTEVDQSWERPKVFDVGKGGVEVTKNPGLQEKLNEIIIPQVNFSGMELSRVLSTLSELSYEYAKDKQGVNIIPLYNSSNGDPRVNISLRNLSLDRILQFVTQQVNFAYDVGEVAVTVSQDGTGDEVSAATEFFPVSRATVIRLTGFRDGGGSSSAGPVDPFAAPSSNVSSGPSANDEVEALQSFFQSAGVNFELPGTSLAFDGQQLIVTQTRRNLERMRTILRNYNEVKQVEIEAKFLEVSQNDLEELGFDWGLGGGSQFVYDSEGDQKFDSNNNPVLSYKRNISTQGRSLNDAFGIGASSSAITVNSGGNSEVLGTNSAPSVKSAIDLASAATNLFSAVGWSVGGYDVDFAIRALARKSGSDLMSAPKVTVLSGKRATITVAQELRYPESYGDIESEASGGGNTNTNGLGGSSGSISITAGTPQDFVTRNVGVEMSVTPNVENDDTISLILEPRVTEFEGFVEYGGPSIAISGSTTVTVPAGFYQPVFSTREMSTEVTVFDGATVVMGGLTRDEVKTVNDKVPVLGDIPGIGRLFRSEGETRQKRNLLIFVTANLVSPGGSPARQSYRNVKANSLFQNPTVLTPAGAANRSISPNKGE